jgi:leucyl aminopeptidase
MKYLSLLPALVAVVCAVPHVVDQEVLVGNYQPDSFTNTGLDLDLDARRLVRVEGREPVWMTELEKVRAVHVHAAFECAN